MIAHQAPLFMGFPGQEYQSGLPFPSPRDLPDPGVKPVSPALAGRFFATEPRGKPSTLLNNVKLFFKVVVPTTAATRVMMFQFCILTILSLICRLDALGMLSHALFYYAFLWFLLRLYIFYILLTTRVSSSVHPLCPFFRSVILFCLLFCRNCVCVWWIYTPGPWLVFSLKKSLVPQFPHLLNKGNIIKQVCIIIIK